MNSIKEAQNDMRDAYLDGVPGIICSGSVWLVAGIIALSIKPITGILALIFGGMLIFPISVVLCKVLGRRGKHAKGNPLAPLAIEGTIWMLLSIPIAIVAAMYNQLYFFPAMLLVIAGRYLTFTTIYGIKTFYFFSAVLVMSGVLVALLHSPVYIGALAGGVVEILFAAIIFKQSKKIEGYW